MVCGFHIYSIHFCLKPLQRQCAPILLCNLKYKDVLLEFSLKKRKRLAVIISYYPLLIPCLNITSFLKPLCIPLRLSSLSIFLLSISLFYVFISIYFTALQYIIYYCFPYYNVRESTQSTNSPLYSKGSHSTHSSLSIHWRRIE